MSLRRVRLTADHVEWFSLGPRALAWATGGATVWFALRASPDDRAVLLSCATAFATASALLLVLGRLQEHVEDAEPPAIPAAAPAEAVAVAATAVDEARVRSCHRDDAH